MIVRGAISGVVWAIFILVFSFYMVKDAPHFGRFVAINVPEPLRPELSRLWHEIVRIWNSFVRGQFGVAFIMGITVMVTMGALGVRNAAVLGLISGVMEFVPAIGPVIAAVPGVLIAIFLGSSWLPIPNLWFALVVGLTYFLLQQFENLYLVPRVVGSRVRLHPAVVIVGVLAGLQLGGILGVLLAAPTIASARVLLGYVYGKLFDTEPFRPIEAPRDRSQLWKELVQEHSVRAVLFDLDGTLIETDDVAVAAVAARSALPGPAGDRGAASASGKAFADGQRGTCQRADDVSRPSRSGQPAVPAERCPPPLARHPQAGGLRRRRRQP